MKPATDEVEKALRNVVAAWESIPGDQHYSVTVIQRWLIDDMAPAIMRARKALGLPIPKSAKERMVAESQKLDLP